MTWQIVTLALVMLVIGTGLVWYERTRPPSQIVALVALLAALAVVGRILLAPLPNVVAPSNQQRPNPMKTMPLQRKGPRPRRSLPPPP